MRKLFVSSYYHRMEVTPRDSTKHTIDTKLSPHHNHYKSDSKPPSHNVLRSVPVRLGRPVTTESDNIELSQVFGDVTVRMIDVRR
jgi:hypothetical protein